MQNSCKTIALHNCDSIIENDKFAEMKKVVDVQN